MFVFNRISQTIFRSELLLRIIFETIHYTVYGGGQ